MRNRLIFQHRKSLLLHISLYFMLKNGELTSLVHACLSYFLIKKWIGIFCLLFENLQSQILKLVRYPFYCPHYCQLFCHCIIRISFYPTLATNSSLFPLLSPVTSLRPFQILLRISSKIIQLLLLLDPKVSDFPDSKFHLCCTAIASKLEA